MGKRGPKQTAWDELTEHTKKQYFYANDPRVPADYVPAHGKRSPKADTLEWMLREKKRIEDRLKILTFKINILQAPKAEVKEFEFK